MSWVFVISLASALAHPSPTPLRPIQPIPTQWHEIAVHVPTRERCIQLMKQWDGRHRIGDQPITQKKCMQAPAERPAPIRKPLFMV